jgi:hypothetical protein
MNFPIFIGNQFEFPVSMHLFTFSQFQLSDLSYTTILKHSADIPDVKERGYLDLVPQQIELNHCSFQMQSNALVIETVLVDQGLDSVRLTCSCFGARDQLCKHQIQVLYNLVKSKEMRLFFNHTERHHFLKITAKDYGLEHEENLDALFSLHYTKDKLKVLPKSSNILAVNHASIEFLEATLLSQPPSPPIPFTHRDTFKIVVIGQHKYFDHFHISLLESEQTKEGAIKNPINEINPLDQIWSTQDPAILQFYSSISIFQNKYRTKSDRDLIAIKSILKNPLHYPFYHHQIQISENFNATSLTPIQVHQSEVGFQLNVHQAQDFYEITGHLTLAGRPFNLEKVVMMYAYFILMGNEFHFIEDQDLLKTLTYFQKNNNRILIHQSKFLSKLEEKVKIVYTYLKVATPKQLEEKGYDLPNEKIIYLTDHGNHITLIPVVKYGSVEISIFSKKQIQSIDKRGYPFTVKRDETLELEFQGQIMHAHPDFYNQVYAQQFYLYKKEFLNEDWFLQAFAEWQQANIQILGFNSIKNNKLNLHKASVTVHVVSGINWFNTTLDVKFGKEKATLKQLQKAAQNRTKYIQLDDGTQGILPTAWLEKFIRYFEAGEIQEDTLKTPKINFSGIQDLYDAHLLNDEVKEEVKFLQEKLAQFESIEAVEVPKDLLTPLRDYQLQGLNWLNFLDEFGFGGCLADDMGLGKTVQIIAFILSQREKVNQNTNLIVVPTSLLFNWQHEISRFAPSIKFLGLHGSQRVKDIHHFGAYEIILTTYGTLLSDVHLLKKYKFNYIILDESNAIKNPDSQRYKAVKLLKSRNKIIMTGTPVENNTFDIYGQFSFACPGLLGNKTQFKNHYAIPIDQFHDTKRATELQQKIQPFLLRRTKKQVAHELPDKTEMILYCEMGEEQRKVYNAYEEEFRNFLDGQDEGDLLKNSMHVLQGLTKLRQICNSPALLNNTESYGFSASKMDILMEQVESKAPHHKILIFSQFVTMLDLIREQLQKRGIEHEYLTGQSTKRAEIVHHFQNNDQVRVFLISLKAGGTGLNLTAADYVYLVDPWWNPAAENQAIDRCYRIGQKKNVIAVRLICPDTIEEKILILQESKKDLADGLIKTDAHMLKSFSKNDLLNLIHKP